MNTLARPENIEQLPKILWWRITRKNNRIHGCQRFSTTIDCFSDMLSTILQKNDGTVTTRINPKRYWYLSMPFLELQSAQKPDDSHQRDSSKNLQKHKIQHAKSKEHSKKAQGGFKETHTAIARTPIQ
jgi:hypothetical protein